MPICDICGEPGESGAMANISSARIKALTKKGFMPRRLPQSMREMAANPDMENMLLQAPDGAGLDIDMRNPNSALRALWALTVASNTTDWAVCPNCQSEIRAHGQPEPSKAANTPQSRPSATKTGSSPATPMRPIILAVLLLICIGLVLLLAGAPDDVPLAPASDTTASE